MNNLISNFPQILEFAAAAKIPLDKKRAILREFLQTKCLSILYAQPQSKQLSFIGGTSLRLLRNLDRFSEDLDFDNLGLSNAELVKLIEFLINKLKLESIEVDLKQVLKGEKVYFELRFPDILFQLKITTNPREKLMIKIDSSQTWKGQTSEVVLLNKYGLIEQVLTNPLNQLLIQKLGAYVSRKQTQPRDIYDVVWLYSQGARPDLEFMKANQLEDLVEKAQAKFSQEPLTNAMRTRLAPFLFQPESIRKLELFGSVLEELCK